MKKNSYQFGDCTDHNFLMSRFNDIKIDDLYHSAAYNVNFGEKILIQ